MLQHFSELIDKVKAMPRTVVCVANADSETVEAARMALDEGLADVILYGDEAVVRPLVGQAGIEGRVELRHAADPATALREAVRSVRCGESGVLMKGMLNSSDFLRGVLNKEEGLRTGRRLSHIAAVELPGYHKLIYSTDGGMNIDPRPCRQEGHPCQRAAGAALVGLRMPQGRLPCRQRARRSAQPRDHRRRRAG